MVYGPRGSGCDKYQTYSNVLSLYLIHVHGLHHVDLQVAFFMFAVGFLCHPQQPFGYLSSSVVFPTPLRVLPTYPASVGMSGT